MQPDPGTMTMLVFRAVCSAIAASGGNVAELLGELDLPLESLSDADGRVPVELAFRVFADAPRLTKDEDFAIHAAENMGPGALELLDYMLTSSHTAREALLRVARYYVVVDSGTGLVVEESGDVLRVASKNRTSLVAPRIATELLLATIVARGRKLTQAEVPLRAVEFTHAAPPRIGEYERFFRAPVRFSQAFDQLIIDRAWADAPIPTADRALASVMDRFLQSIVEKLPPADGFLDNVRRAVAAALPGGEPSVEATSAALAMSQRTLQRRLHEQKTSHQDVVDAVRRDLAVRYLVNERVAIGEVAYLLGFSDPTTFHRAFKRWTGSTPNEYRKSLDPRSLGRKDTPG